MFFVTCGMVIPIFIKNNFFDLFLYYFKGAKVVAALHYIKRSRHSTGSYVRPGAMHLPEGENYFDAKDMINIWEIKGFFGLTLKNNSKYFAYNLQILNPEVFTYCAKLKPLTSLAPNESITLDVNIIQSYHSVSGVDADAQPIIPISLKNSILQIQYTNEAGTRLKTLFFIDNEKITNQHYFA
ncbi:hypothetical protein FW778_22460 [Ginsengibacter hankyongi]|uniref:Uncharacterized protein n=1 Tax=Ginsengibacter hankyongi TaxID=2607284 RepID=A0A5J5I9Q7_9BACT|nr:hypothetical protein [Ginsengibacter hankyongi]KAA9034446.1 hypothetical protein FW778_22460 [Ginsengibacter hankyongi]